MKGYKLNEADFDYLRVQKSWVSSEALSSLAVSKSWSESVCVLITP